MEKQFVNYEIAVKLKELGFDEECLMWYCHENNLTNDQIFRQYKKEDYFCEAPLWQDAIKWLFEKLDFYYPYLKIEIFSDGSGTWHSPDVDGNEKLDLDFDNLEQCVLLGIKEIEKQIK